MRKSDRIRLIYRELRATLGSGVPGRDIARLAHFVLRSYLSEELSEPLEDRLQERRSFIGYAIDDAIKDGGWRVLSFEDRRAWNPDALDTCDLIAFNRHLQRWLGPEWQQKHPPE